MSAKVTWRLRVRRDGGRSVGFGGRRRARDLHRRISDVHGQVRSHAAAFLVLAPPIRLANRTGPPREHVD